MHPILDAFRAQQGDQSIFGALVPFLLIAVVFYFLFFRPQAKQQKKHQAFLQGLKKGDEVITQGGIIGEVYAVEDTVVTVHVGGGVKLRVLKGNIVGGWKEQAAGAAPEKK